VPRVGTHAAGRRVLAMLRLHVPRDVPALSIETPGDSGHVFQRNQVDPRLIDVRAGEYMPLEDAAERDLEQPLI
jgi:hypothetical protein